MFYNTNTTLITQPAINNLPNYTAFDVKNCRNTERVCNYKYNSENDQMRDYFGVSVNEAKKTAKGVCLLTDFAASSSSESHQLRGSSLIILSGDLLKDDLGPDVFLLDEGEPLIKIRSLVSSSSTVSAALD